jgi:hypothetical protein
MQQGTGRWRPTATGYRCFRKGLKPTTIIDGAPLGCFHFGGSCQICGTAGSTTIRNVAMGPRNSEISHHSKPLRPFGCARPALMRESVPQPTKKSGGNCMTTMIQPQFVIRWRQELVGNLTPT